MNQLFLAISAGVLSDSLAEGAPHHTGPDFGKASPFGLLVVVLLVIATFFLVRSMNNQLKKVPKSFDREHPEPDQAADEGPDAVGEVEHDPRPGPHDEPG